MSDGLVSNGVSCIAHDSYGQLWVGTAEGVSVYNGYEFTNYRTSDGLALDYVTCLAESRSVPGMMWIGTIWNGISRFYEGRFTTLHPDTGKFANFINSLLEDYDGSLWCATRVGLYIARGNSNFRKMCNGSVLAIAQGADSTVWAATENAIVLFSSAGDSITTIDLRRTGYVVDMIADKNFMWLATNDGTLLQFRNTTLIQSRTLPVGEVSALVGDGNGMMWVCTDSGMIEISKSRPGSGNYFKYTVENGLLTNFVRTGFVDREANLWIGMSGVHGGLQKLSHRNLTFVSITEMPLGFFYPNPTTFHRTGSVWAISVDGVWEIRKDEQGTWTKHLHGKKELSLKGTIMDVQHDSQGRILITDDNRAIHAYEVHGSDNGPSRLHLVQTYDIAKQFPGKHCGIFTIDHKGNLWANIVDVCLAVFASDGRLLKTLSTEEGIPSTGLLRAMHVDRNGTIWMGGMAEGASFLKGSDFHQNRFQQLKSKEYLPDGVIRSIAEDSMGRMLFGTRFDGLIVYDDGRFTTVNIRDGLLSNCIWSIDVDATGRIWLGTQLGVQAVDEKTLRPLPVMKALSGHGVIYCRASGGTVVGYGYGSVLLYDIDVPDTSMRPPPIHVRYFETDGHRSSIGEPIELSFDQSSCTIGFVGISLRDENRLRYRYRVSGIDEKWSPPTTQRAVTLAQLSPQTYTFEVKAITENGVESIRPAALSFTVHAPPWRTWWAYSLYAVIAVLSVVGWRRFENNKIRQKERDAASLRESELRLELEKQRTRMQIARDLHDEVGSTLSSISFFAQAIRRESEQKHNGGDVKFLSLISESSAHAKEAMSDIIWSINPANDSWDSVVSKLRRYASDLFESKGIAHSIEMPLAGMTATIDPERRRHVWLIFKELVTNAAKHSQCTEARIHLRAQGGRVALSISDNGIGFDPHSHPTGHGLKNIEARAKVLSATVDLITSHGSGTRWEVSFPV